MNKCPPGYTKKAHEHNGTHTLCEKISSNSLYPHRIIVNDNGDLFAHQYSNAPELCVSKNINYFTTCRTQIDINGVKRYKAVHLEMLPASASGRRRKSRSKNTRLFRKKH